MAIPSDIYQQEGTEKLYFKPTEGSDFSYITSPTELQKLAQQGMVKIGTPYKKIPAQPTAQIPARGGAVIPQNLPAPVTIDRLQQPQGSATAFNLAFSQLMAHGQKMQGLQDAKNVLIKQRYGEQITPAELQTLSPAQQAALRSGDNNLLDYQIMGLNDMIKGRVDENKNALNLLFSGYQEDQEAIQRQQEEAEVKKTKAIQSFQGMLDKHPQLWAALSDEGRTAIINGEMPSQGDIAKVGLEYSKYVKQYGGEMGAVITTKGAKVSDVLSSEFASVPAAPLQPQKTFEQFIAEKEKAAGMSLSPKAREALRSEYETMIKTQTPAIRPETDISKFHPKIQGLITGLYDLGTDFTDTEKTKFADQINRAAREGLLKDQISAGGKMKNDAYWKAAERLSTNYKKETGGYITMRDAYQKGLAISSDTKNPYDDVTLIFAYMKVNDPTSVVREGEYATAQNTAGVPTRIRNMYNAALTGRKLNKNQIDSIKKTMAGQYNQQLKNYENVRNIFTERAEKQRIDPEDAIINYSETVKQSNLVSSSLKDSNYVKSLKLSR